MKMRPQYGLATVLVVAALAILSLPAFALNPPYDPLTLTCVATGAGNDHVTIDVKAGGTGAPAGFSLQWMSVSDYEANGNQWFDSSDPRLCKQSFSGQPSFTGNTTTRWELGPGDDIQIEVGDVLYDETGSSGDLSTGGNPNCSLKCGTDYYFRAFPHASRFNSRGAFSFISGDGSPNLVEPGELCGTSTDCGGCTLTQGYWKTHGPVGCQTGNNSDTWNEGIWPGGVLTLGTVGYTPAQICAILNKPAAGNGLIILAHQLIAAKLNSLVNGAHCDDATDIAAADAYLGSKIVPPTAGGVSVKPGALPSGLVSALDSFNSGLGCAQHCTVQRAGANGGKSVRWGQVKIRYR